MSAYVNPAIYAVLPKIYRPKTQQAADAAEDYGDDYDDTPPWEDEDETESEGEE